jgi:hypothetical protein
MKKYITFEEAVKLGYKFIFTSDNVEPLDKDELKETLTYKEEVELADKEFDYMILDARSIVENACDDLWEEATEHVIGNGKLWQQFDALCKKMTKAYMSETASYHHSGIFIKEL